MKSTSLRTSARAFTPSSCPHVSAFDQTPSPVSADVFYGRPLRREATRGMKQLHNLSLCVSSQVTKPFPGRFSFPPTRYSGTTRYSWDQTPEPISALVAVVDLNPRPLAR